MRLSKRKTVLGVDGCRAGWIWFEVDLNTEETRVGIVPDFVTLLQIKPSPRVVAIDVPIGLPEHKPRNCDLGARRLLGKPRSSSVFPPPVRNALGARTYDRAIMLNRRGYGKAMTKQTFAILPKIRQVDEGMKRQMQSWIYEVHPELCFWSLNHRQPMKYMKSNREGTDERLTVLSPYFPHVMNHLEEIERGKAGVDDLLDAAAAAWTATRIAHESAESVCALPEKDTHGLRMQIHY